MCILSAIVVFLILGFFGAPFFLWLGAILAYEFCFYLPLWVEIATAAVGLFFVIHPLRRIVITRPLMMILKNIGLIPTISPTEKQAIEAGTAWVEKEFFKGTPDLKLLMSQPVPTLTHEEREFLNNQVETLCSMIDDWQLWRERDLPENVWAYIRKERFLGMIIPKEYGGMEFSAFAHSEVIKKIASKSFVVAIYVMVPNSLGPAELLNHYGTEEQKKYFLPRLAQGIEIPCFGLTEVKAGSDAGNVQANGVLFKKDGELYIRLNWDKRYISLAKISTIIGLAFTLHDPEKLLGGKEDLGITCALIPSKTPGVILEHRHDPLGVPFYNCPMHGKDVIVPASAVVGGLKNAGTGWKMLMECLAAGRGISFPAQMAGSSQLVTRMLVPYAQVREQFGISISKFEGVQVPLARVVGFTYLLEALRKYTLSALNQGIKPAVIASIAKYYSTEHSRKLMNDAMDVFGGAGISLGKRNKIAPYYIAAPISITVEGANILTRSLMIFGQGAFRAHPFAFSMIDGLEKNDVPKFDIAFFSLVGHGVQNFVRSMLLSITRGWLAFPFAFKKQSKYYRKISWASASFAFFTDVAMGGLGGKLKLKESITSRFADIVSYLYLAAAVLHKYESEGEKAEDWALAKYSLDHVFGEIEIAFQGLYANFPVPGISLILKGPVLGWSRLNPIGAPVCDRDIEEVLKVTYPKEPMPSELNTIERLTQGIHMPKDPDDHLVQTLAAAKLQLKVEPLVKKMKHDKTYAPTTLELAQLDEWRAAQAYVVAVDEFTEDQYHHRDVASRNPL